MTSVGGVIIIMFIILIDQNRESFLLNNGCQVLTKYVVEISDVGVSESERYLCVICGCLLNLITDNGKCCSYILQELIPQITVNYGTCTVTNSTDN